MLTFGIHGLDWLMVRTRSSSDTLRSMEAIEVIEEILSKKMSTFGTHRLDQSSMHRS
jgi:hypothetical protein